MSAEDDREFYLRLLRIATEDADLDPAELEFAVITGGTTHVAGNPNGPMRGQVVRVPVTYYPFEKGEVIVLPADGFREAFGGRSTSKYDVQTERFGRDWDAAMRRSAEVKAAPARDAFAGPPA
jgi:hypothetical protein